MKGKKNHSPNITTKCTEKYTTHTRSNLRERIGVAIVLFPYGYPLYIPLLFPRCSQSLSFLTLLLLLLTVELLEYFVQYIC